MAADREPALTKQSERGIRDGSSNLRTRTLNEVSDKRRMWFKWSERTDALVRYLGINDLLYDENGFPTALTRVAPMRHPESDFLHVTRFTEQSLHKVLSSVYNAQKDRSVSATFKMVDVELVYERLPYRALSDDDPEWDGFEFKRFVSIGEKKASADYLTIPGGVLKYIAPTVGAPVDRKLIQYNNGIVVPTVEFQITWHRLPAALWNYDIPNLWTDRINGTDDDYSFIGTINKHEFKGYPAGTLLLTNVSDQQCPAPNDLDQTWNDLLQFPYEMNIIFSVHFNPMGWNYLYYNDISGTTGAGKSGWYFVGRGTTEYQPGNVPDEYSLYNERDFRSLFYVGNSPYE
jgi:hypothetical protein